MDADFADLDWDLKHSIERRCSGTLANDGYTLYLNASTNEPKYLDTESDCEVIAPLTRQSFVRVRGCVEVVLLCIENGKSQSEMRCRQIRMHECTLLKSHPSIPVAWKDGGWRRLNWHKILLCGCRDTSSVSMAAALWNVDLEQA